MIARTSILVTFGALALAAAVNAPSPASAGDWFQPPGSVKVGEARPYPDGSLFHVFQMPDGSRRVVVTDRKNRVRRYIDTDSKTIPLNPKTPPGGNPFLLDRAGGNGSLSVGAGG